MVLLFSCLVVSDSLKPQWSGHSVPNRLNSQGKLYPIYKGERMNSIPLKEKVGELLNVVVS